MSTGTILRKPRPQEDAATAARNVMNPTMQPIVSKVSDAPPSNITELTAVADRPTPMTTMMQPVTTGGSTLSIQPVPVSFTMPATTQSATPTATIPQSAPEMPSTAVTTAMGVMKLNDTPK